MLFVQARAQKWSATWVVLVGISLAFSSIMLCRLDNLISWC